MTTPADSKRFETMLFPLSSSFPAELRAVLRHVAGLIQQLPRRCLKARPLPPPPSCQHTVMRHLPPAWERIRCRMRRFGLIRRLANPLKQH